MPITNNHNKTFFYYLFSSIMETVMPMPQYLKEKQI